MIVNIIRIIKKWIDKRNKKYYEKNRKKSIAYAKQYFIDNRVKRLKQIREHEKNNIEAWMKIIHEKGMDFCWECNYNKCFAAIEFHHPDPKDKKFNIGHIITYKPTPERILELEKTTPLCANCHRELEYEIKKLVKEEIG